MNVNTYGDFVASDFFTALVNGIPNTSVREAVIKYGIGDNLDRNDRGDIFYDFESGNLIESEVQEALSPLEDEEYDRNKAAIGNLAEGYAAWVTLGKENL